MEKFKKEVRMEAAREVADGMKVGCIASLTKHGIELISEYIEDLKVENKKLKEKRFVQRYFEKSDRLKRLEYEKQELIDKLEEDLRELEGVYTDADFQNGERLVLKKILSYINKAGD